MSSPGWAFEWSDDLARDPAAVEVAFLSLDEFVVEATSVDAARVDRNMIFQGFKCSSWSRVTPGGGGYDPFLDDDVPVVRLSLEFANAPSRRWLEEFPDHICRRNVDSWRVAGFKHTVGTGRSGNRLTINNNSYTPLERFETRRTRIFPN